MRSPRYSTTRSPALILRAAYTPRPWMRETFTTILGCRRRLVRVAAERLAGRALLDIVQRSERVWKARSIAEDACLSALGSPQAAACAGIGRSSVRASILNARLCSGAAVLLRSASAQTVPVSHFS